MGHRHFSAHGFRELLVSILDSAETSQRYRSVISWIILISGLAVWICAQGYLVLGPLWSRVLPPEVDDSLAFLVRTQVMEECFFQDCPSLEDLRKQLHVGSSNPDVSRQRQIAGFPFPFYHPLFSLILLSAKKWVLDLPAGYRVVWSLSPVFFSVAIACLLGSLWSKPAAGAALWLLAFKVFPNNGLHYLTPSNLAMGMALLMWARIISRRGDAPWVLVFGSIALAAMHPIGGIYAIIGALIMFFISGPNRGLRTWLSILSLFLIMCVAVAIGSLVKRPSAFDIFYHVGGFPGITEVFNIYMGNMTEILVHIVRLKEGLFGSISLFCFALSLGLFATPKESRRVIAWVFVIYAFFLFGVLYHTDPLCSSGELFFRIWIPVVVIFFGAVGNALWYALRGTLRLFKGRLIDLQEPADFNIKKIWPALVLALLIGYSFDMGLSGSEQIYATREYMRNRQPFSFDSAQPKLLLSQAEPGDRVLYTSTMIMSSYFIHGSMRFGAVYYHPAFKGTGMETEWLQRSDLRFAAAYNPTVYHPSFEELDEKDRCITGPEFRFSPLSRPRKHGPISREGFIPAADFRWIQIAPKRKDFPKRLRVLIRNPEESSKVEVIPLDKNGNLLFQFKAGATIQAKWNGWIELDIGKAVQANRFRILLPRGKCRFSIGGIVFGKDKHHWPWSQKAELIFCANDPDTGNVVLNFDPADSLPSPLNESKLTVLDDHGSSVLFRIDR